MLLALDEEEITDALDLLCSESSCHPLLHWTIPEDAAAHWCHHASVDIITDIVEFISAGFKTKTAEVFPIGSAKWGFSPLTLNRFSPTSSDLDLTIIDPILYSTYLSTYPGNLQQPICLRLDKMIEGAQKDHVSRLLDQCSHYARDYFSDVHVSIYARREDVRVSQFSSLRTLYSVWRSPFRSITDHLDPRRGTAEEVWAGSSQLAAIHAIEVDPSHLHPNNSSPFVVSFSSLKRTFVNGERARLLSRLAYCIEAFGGSLNFHYMLIGGSFLDPGECAPADLDCLVYYSIQGGADSGSVSDQVLAANHVFRLHRIDCRLVPIDASPLITIQLTAFMSQLYSRNKRERKGAFTLLLVEF